MLSRRPYARHNRGRVSVAGVDATETVTASANNILWLDANDLTVGTGTTWPDRSVAGNDATFVASPTIDTGWTGGAKRVVLNGTTQYLHANGVASAISGDDKPFSFAMVFQAANASGYYGYFDLAHSASAGKLSFYKNLATAGAFVAYAQGDSAAGVQDLQATNNGNKRVMVVSYTGTALTSWIDNVKRHNAAALNVPAKTLNRFSIGALLSGGTPGNFANMSFVVAQAWDIALSDAEAAEAYTLLSPRL